METRGDTGGALLDVEDLRVTFATPEGRLHAVRGVRLSVGAGEIVGLVGESGSGKSVTGRAILRILAPSATVEGGSIRFRGREVTAFSEREARDYRGRGAAIVFQEPGQSFDPLYTIGKSLVETLRAHDRLISLEQARSRAVDLLREVHIPDAHRRLDSYPHQLSGGLLQRVGIAHALASSPALIIADEPTTALDATIQAQIVDLIRELRRTRRLGVLFVTHDLSLARTIADRVVVMYAGLIMEEGDSQRVLDTPRHPYTRGLLASTIPVGAHHSNHRLTPLVGTPPNPLELSPGCPFAPRCPRVTPLCREEVPRLTSGVRCVHAQRDEERDDGTP